ncbi:tryptophan synthase subunit alpha [Acetobacterium bakii]|uniref:Tryptophan synthase alpha chain n=1 Tax=Acetobacterium bakii TaxID=52689 RepID=A0A0L6TYP1_9FIRM|nr:tryptophan synthase subunit alpha [Acetobacterium bakii]KNZ41212.1 tryptophan synthase subunit alpha [Acetobacterium bakii]
MSKISEIFKNNKAFIAFLTAGDPTLEKTAEFILTMEKAGADLVEIGIPFSDPIAEGPVIEKANLRALSVGTTTDKIFDMVKRVRTKTQMPLVFLTYMNPVFVYGVEKFFKNCRETGINGIIIPDLPYEEKNEVLGVATAYDVDVITLIAPTSKDRIQTLAKDATGFIYLVSSMGVTGVRSEIKTDINAIIADIKQVSKTPVAVGFGISTPVQAKEISKTADGVIVGSAIVRIIAEHGENAGDVLFKYVKSLKDAIS